MLTIVFENEHFLVIYKTSGWLTIPSRLGDDDPRPVLAKLLSAQGSKAFVVHRLDADVRGLVLFAKNAAAHRAASLWFEHRSIKKTYQAFTTCLANDPPPEGTRFVWEDRLVRGKKRSFVAPHGKAARTEALCRKVYSTVHGPILDWELHPVTGRTHQLRVHLSMHGFTILGDALYGSTIPLREPGLCLLSHNLDMRSCADAPTFGLPPQVDAPLMLLADFL